MSNGQFWPKPGKWCLISVHLVVFENMTLRFLLLLLIYVSSHSAYALEPPPSEDPTPPSQQALLEDLAASLTKETSVAISPLIGLSYLVLTGDPSVEKMKPWIWIVIALLVLIVLKDVGGVAIPGILKKPLDALEMFQNQGLGLLAAGLFVPEMHQEMVAYFEATASSQEWAGTGQTIHLAASAPAEIWTWLTLPLSIACFAAVWLLSNCLNALILFSPSSIVDACLKGIKVAGLSVIGALAAVHPYLGAVLSLVIVLLALYLFGKALRLYHFGMVFAVDLVTRKYKRFQPVSGEVQAFLDQELAEVPSRTYGTLKQGTDGGFTFTYRPWIVLPRQTVTLTFAHPILIGRGLIHPTIEVPNQEDELDTHLHLPPRYLGHEETVGGYFKAEVRDVGLLRGLKAAWAWLKMVWSRTRGAASAG